MTAPLLRVALVGAECTGKTTLAEDLAVALKTYVVPEYWRFYWDAKKHAGDLPIWTTAEFVHVAEEQSRFEDLYASRASKVLLCDTDVLQTGVWHRRYLEFYAPELDRLAAGRRYDLTLLCDADVPFVQDGTRDGESIRGEMTEWLRQRLDASRRPYHLLQGERDERFTRALALVQELLKSGPS